MLRVHSDTHNRRRTVRKRICDYDSTYRVMGMSSNYWNIGDAARG